MTTCRILFFLALLLLLFFCFSRVEPFRPGVGSPYTNVGTHVLGKQKPHKFSLLRYLP